MRKKRGRRRRGCMRAGIPVVIIAQWFTFEGIRVLDVVGIDHRSPARAGAVRDVARGIDLDQVVILAYATCDEKIMS